MSVSSLDVNFLVLLSTLFLQLILPQTNSLMLKRLPLWINIISFAIVFINTFLTILHPTGQVAGSLFMHDNLSLLLVLLCLLFGLLHQWNYLIEKIYFEKETAILQVVVILLGYCVVGFDHLLLANVSLAALLLSLFMTPHLTYKSRADYSLERGTLWSFVVLFLLSMGSAFLYFKYQTLLLSELSSQVSLFGFDGLGKAGWALWFLTPMALLLISSFAFSIKDIEASDSWAHVGSSRLFFSFVLVAFLCRWVLLIGGDFDQGQYVFYKDLNFYLPSLALFIGMSGVLWLQSMVSNRLSLLVQGLVQHPLLLILWAMSAGTRDLVVIGLCGLFVFCFGSFLLLRYLILLDIKPFEGVKSARIALRAASYRDRIIVFVTIMLLTPMGAFWGYDLITKTLEQTEWALLFRVAPIIGSALLLSGVVLFLGNLFEPRNKSDLFSCEQSGLERFVLVSLFLLFIVLGIYPTPLYNYVDRILS